jgi:hypothetical protein
MRYALLCALMLPLAASAQNLYRCTVNGKTSFQDHPCAGATSADNRMQLRPDPATHTPAAHVPAATEASAANDNVAGMNAFADRQAREDQRLHLQYQVKQLQQDIDDNQTAMTRELAAIDARRSLANNNLAGATYLASLSEQSQAVTQSYTLKIQVDQAKIDALNQQLAQLQ